MISTQHLLIYNPAAGRGRAGKMLNSVKDALSNKGIEYELYLTSSKGDALNYLKGVELNALNISSLFG